MNLPLVPQTLDSTCGAACFESMVRRCFGQSPGELHFASELGALTLGYTPVENIVNLARKWGLESQLIREAKLEDLKARCAVNEIVFVTWWYEDSGHYSLVEAIDNENILLMDPWVARNGNYHRMKLKDFEPHWRTRGSVLIAVRTPGTALPILVDPKPL